MSSGQLLKCERWLIAFKVVKLTAVGSQCCGGRSGSKQYYWSFYIYWWWWWHFINIVVLHCKIHSKIHSKSWSSWSLNSADNFEFSAERLSENAKTISLSTQEQKILKFVTNKSQEVLKSFAEKPQISDLHVIGFRSFEILLSNHAFLDFGWFMHFYLEVLLSRFTHFFPQIFLEWKTKSADFFAFRMYGCKGRSNEYQKDKQKLRDSIWLLKRTLSVGSGFSFWVDLTRVPPKLITYPQKWYFIPQK